MQKKPNPSVAMNTQQQALYDALRARDRKFDGRFFVGVSSTGIYCRPVCSARTPKLENCTFYPSAAAAELAGFRPCLKCRPELAPGLALIDLGNRYAQVAVQLIEQGYLSEHSCEALAARLGISDRHLRRIFAEQFGASPIDYAQSHRLLQAKRLLADTDLPLSEVAFAAGFGSLRRFNELFKARYRLIPSALRSGGARGERAAASGLVFHLGYRPPYDWARMLNFLQARRAGRGAGRGAPLPALDRRQPGRHGTPRLAQRAAGRGAQSGSGRDCADAQSGDDGGVAPGAPAV